MSWGEGPDTLSIAVEHGLRRRLAEMTADRDRLRAELERMTDERNAWRTGHQDRLIEVDRLRAELARVKRNHLRRMARVSGMRSRELFDEARLIEADQDSWLRRNSRRLFRLATEARAALYRMEATQ